MLWINKSLYIFKRLVKKIYFNMYKNNKTLEIILLIDKVTQFKSQ